jgi:hypothetical protein
LAPRRGLKEPPQAAGFLRPAAPPGARLSARKAPTLAFPALPAYNEGVNNRVKHSSQEARKLPAAERAALIDDLLAVKVHLRVGVRDDSLKA